MRNIALGIAASLGLLAGASAHAATFNSTTWTAGGCVGATSCVVDGITVTAAPIGSTFIEQTFAKSGPTITGLGVNTTGDGSSGAANEIQANFSEKITLDFSGFAGGRIGIASAKIAHLYNPDDFSGDPQEEAIIEAVFVDSSIGSITLKTLSNPSGFSFSSTVGTVSAVKNSIAQGAYTLTNLFGGKAVQTLTFSAVNLTATGDDSDYSLVSVSTVPLPASMLLLLGGLGGLVAVRRKSG